MASTSPSEVGQHSGFETLPGLQIGTYGSAIVNLKAYSFTCTDTGGPVGIVSSSTERSYTISGLSTNDFPISLVASTGFVAGSPYPAHLRVGSANTLNVIWGSPGIGTSTASGALTGLAATPGPFSGVLLTTQIIRLASSTTT